MSSKVAHDAIRLTQVTYLLREPLIGLFIRCVSFAPVCEGSMVDAQSLDWTPDVSQENAAGVGVEGSRVDDHIQPDFVNGPHSSIHDHSRHELGR
jgi:hypothetical protein